MHRLFDSLLHLCGHGTHLEILEIREKSGKIFWMKKSGKNKLVLQMSSKMLTSLIFISMFCQRILVINVTFCFSADELGSRKNNVINSGKMKT